MEPFEQHHLTAERNGDALMLRQIDHSGNEDAIALHVSQLRHLAEQIGLANVGAGEMAARRFRTVAAKLFALANDEFYRSEIAERSGSGNEFLTELDAVCSLADEFLRDLGNADAMLMPDDLDAPDVMDSLAVEVADDGVVFVYQTRTRGMAGCDEHIELHPIQAAWLAAKLSRIAGSVPHLLPGDDDARQRQEAQSVGNSAPTKPEQGALL